MQKTYKLIPPKHISEKMLATYNISTLTEEQVERLCFRCTQDFMPHMTFYPHTIKIDGLAQPWGEACKHCTSRTKNTAGHHAKHCLHQLANGHCTHTPTQNILGKILFPDAQYDEKQRQAIQSSIQTILMASTGASKITPETDLEADLGCDSLTIYETMNEIEYKYNIVLPETNIHNFRTVGDLISFVHKTVAKQR